MNHLQSMQFAKSFWEKSVMPAFVKYIRIPCKSPAFDANWQKTGYLVQAAKLLASWADAQKIPGLKSEVIQPRGKNPLLYVEIPGAGKKTTLLYGHLDKMPETTGWNQDLGPWKPVIKNNRIYGRGTADDGYAFFSAIAAIKLLIEQKTSYNRCVLIIESGEESGSPNFTYYLKRLRRKIGAVDTIISLDSPVGDYKRLWRTTSVRGAVIATLTVEVLKTGVHSGVAGGVIPSSFRILRQLLARIEDINTGTIKLRSCYTKIPAVYKRDAQILARVLGKAIYTALPLAKTIIPLTYDLAELVLNRYWRPTLSVVGSEGIPSISDAGSIIRPKTTIKFAIRIPPFCKPPAIIKELKTVLTRQPPYKATVNFAVVTSSYGWASTKTQPWLDQAIHHASKVYFNGNSLDIGCGGYIGVVPIFAQLFPKAQLVLTGVSGPDSNEHGPNESLFLPAAQKLTCSLAYILSEHYAHNK